MRPRQEGGEVTLSFDSTENAGVTWASAVVTLPDNSKKAIGLADSGSGTWAGTYTALANYTSGDHVYTVVFAARDGAGNESDPVEIIRPDFPWEGSDAPLVESVRSTAYGHVNQLRDPAILEDGDRLFLFYAVAGESGIGVAEIKTQ